MFICTGACACESCNPFRLEILFISVLIDIHFSGDCLWLGNMLNREY